MQIQFRFIYLIILWFVTVLLCIFASPTVDAENIHNNSRCDFNYSILNEVKAVNCSYHSLYIETNAGIKREVKYQLPVGEPPVHGWPVVLIYQGSFFPVEFQRRKNDPFGGFYEAMLIKQLLDAGYAVIAPRAAINLAWQTNMLASATPYRLTTDYQFIGRVIEGIEQGSFGPLNNQRKFATGISSGGYNTSRMALSFPGEFRALAIQSASYAACLGPVCHVPFDLPTDHPPTLFLHGLLDVTVPVWTMKRYYHRLVDSGIYTELWIKPTKGHAWFEESPAKITEWFSRY
ncbi:extracellular medium-chain-length polyhydroxyalkanoate depolymerase [Spartinivicinus ruber]|uniref:extracellular medium-chain-length polyhydroxyalkanoate depolymerase n=1 Tax=Spartinivicinus ruber TaxID=2683272 RepID=UPI0013D16AFA|nr:prolyl oligopeptidase family serine peptidase [Spartinivicinus ruber]